MVVIPTEKIRKFPSAHRRFLPFLPAGGARCLARNPRAGAGGLLAVLQSLRQCRSAMVWGSWEAGALGAASEQNWKSLQSQNNIEELKSCCCVVFFFNLFFSPGSCESVNPFPLEHLSVRFMPPPPPNVAGWLRMFPHLVVPQSEAEDALIWVDAGAALEIEKWPPFAGTIWSNFSSHEWGERH